MNETISLQELFSILRKSFWRILALTIVAALISFAVSSFLIKPTYQAGTQILVTPKKQENEIIDASQVQSSVTLVNTYRVIIKSPAILEQVQKKVPNAPASVGTLNNMVTVESEQNSQVINVSVQSTDAALASNVANSIANVFSSDIKDLMNVDNVKVLSTSGIPTSPVSPNIILNTAIAAVVGLLLGVGLAFLREVLDRRIRTEEQVQQILDLPVLGSIPDIDSKVFKSSSKAANERRSNNMAKKSKMNKDARKLITVTQPKSLSLNNIGQFVRILNSWLSIVRFRPFLLHLLRKGKGSQRLRPILQSLTRNKEKKS